MTLHRTSNHGIMSLNLYLKVIIPALFRKTTWMLFGICAPRLLLAALAHPGFSKAFSQENCVNSKRINLSIDNFKNEGVRPLFNSRLGDPTTEFIEDSDFNQYCPPEWNALTTEAKAKLANLLSWENLSKWEFNIVEVADLTRDPLLLVGWALLCEPMAQEAMERSLLVKGDANAYSEGEDVGSAEMDFNIVELANLVRDPLLLVGWALLCEPMAQEAMERSLLVKGDANAYSEGEDVGSTRTKSYHYHFSEHIKINPRTICNFLREVELRYKLENPYHNNIHAADVTQTTHCLFQLMGEQHIYDRITIFSVLLAATFHDVDHPGTNNLFQQNAMTRLAIEYNDVSILENMHSAVGHSLLFGEKKREGCDIFEGWMLDEKIRARNIMTQSILCTDMSNHFVHADELDSLIDQVRKLANDIAEDDTDSEIGRNEPQPILSILAQTPATDEHRECNQLANLFIKFLLHAADISNPVKTEDLAIYWADCALSEFFAQGDEEKKMGLSISPLCDRDTVKRHDSQIGFIKFVIQPTFELIGEIIPRVKEDIMPAVDNNLEYWKREKLRLSTSDIKESLSGIEEE
eukprot:CAMPEP_0202032052 /NCGR_PEP_ID=MMETSP0905-20130828/65327_1 /ASSEMBLY_ACC=CAM_ASM_000554 /TAXON_ID=420261 /ORGANISM="Thalassiosira antarctica, Strain CCMP982" /LENGTH=578 /DNA_ID=CAMNT_0048595905 /DNA_START=77 /DNA_END=1814 /DNA_ORIENTATION=-